MLVGLIGGVAVAAPGLMGSAANSSAAPSTPRPPAANGGTPNPAATAAPDPGASVAPSADPSADPTSAPVFTTPRPATARPATATPKPATPAPTPPPDFVTPQVGAVGAIFHITFTGLPAAAPYRTSYTRGSVVTGYTTGEVPSNGVAVFDLRTSAGSFPPDTYFFTIRAGNAVKTVTFRVTG